MEKPRDSIEVSETHRNWRRGETLTQGPGLLIGQRTNSKRRESQTCSDETDTGYLCPHQTPLLSHATHSRFGETCVCIRFSNNNKFCYRNKLHLSSFLFHSRVQSPSSVTSSAMLEGKRERKTGCSVFIAA